MRVRKTQNTFEAIRKNTRPGSSVRPVRRGSMNTIPTASRSPTSGRAWRMTSQAWGREDQGREEGPHPGARPSCASSILKKILSEYENDLLILINLQRY